MIKTQDQLKTHVSEKSNESVDIKPGRTIEDIYVSLRRRGKILRGQGSKDAPILKAEEKVLLLPERSIRIIKEFLVDLKDKGSTDLKQLKQENELLKETGEHLFNKIKEQHERDKVVGAPEERQAKQMLEEYENMLALSVPKFKSIENNLIHISKEYCSTLDHNCVLGKEQHKLYAKFLEVKREVNKLNQEANDLMELQNGIREIGAERYRKKERAVEKQMKIIAELNELISQITQENEVLLNTLNEKETALQTLEDNCDHIGIKEMNSHIQDGINGFVASQQERRQYQDEAEDLPADWDKRFKGYITEMSTELKNALNEYPSNKNFPGVSSDWINANKEEMDLHIQNKILERSRSAQSIKIALLRDIQSDIALIRQRLTESKLSIN